MQTVINVYGRFDSATAIWYIVITSLKKLADGGHARGSGRNDFCSQEALWRLGGAIGIERVCQIGQYVVHVSNNGQIVVRR